MPSKRKRRLYVPRLSGRSATDDKRVQPHGGLQPLPWQLECATKLSQEVLRSTCGVLEAKQGMGKTYTAGLTVQHLRKSLAGRSLTLAVSDTLVLARDQATEYSADICGLRVSCHTKRLVNEASNSPVATVTRRSMINLLRPTDGASSRLVQLLQNGQYDTVIIVLDEVDKYVSGTTVITPLLAEARECLKSLKCKMLVIGMGSHPFHRHSKSFRPITEEVLLQNVKHVYGTANPCTIRPTAQHVADYRANLWQGQTPKTFPEPEDVKPGPHLDDVRQMFLGMMLLSMPSTGPFLAGDLAIDGKCFSAQAHQALMHHSLVNTIGYAEAKQIVEAVGSQSLGREPSPDMSRVTAVQDGRVEATEQCSHHHLLLMSFDTKGGRKFVADKFREDPDHGNYESRPYDFVYCAKKGDEAGVETNIERAKELGRANARTCIALVRFEFRSINSFGKLFTGAIACGGRRWDDQKLEDFATRLHRGPTPETGDFYAHFPLLSHRRCALFERIHHNVQKNASNLIKGEDAAVHGDIIDQIRTKYSDSSCEYVNLLRLFDPTTNRPFSLPIGTPEDVVQQYARLLAERDERHYNFGVYCREYIDRVDQSYMIHGEDTGHSDDDGGEAET